MLAIIKEVYAECVEMVAMRYLCSSDSFEKANKKTVFFYRPEGK